MNASTVAEVRKSAEESFASGLFCAESVVQAIAKAEGIESDLLPRAATAFCGGLSRTCGTCGALSGAIMGVSLVLGRSSAKDSVEPCYTAVRKVIQAFEDKFGSSDCQALLDGCNLNTAEGQARFREKQMGRRCLEYTGKAAEIAARVLSQGNR